MAHFDRCNICDYKQQEGSSYAGVGPGRHGKVRRYGENIFLCDECISVISETLGEFYIADEEKLHGNDSQNPPTLPVREEP